MLTVDNRPERSLYLPASLEKKVLSLPKYALTVAQAPAGFGKTAALHTRLHQLSSVFYLSCRDGSIYHYWTRFIEIVGTFDPSCGDKLRFLSPRFSGDLPLIGEALQDAVFSHPVYFVMESFQKLPLPDPTGFLHMLAESACRNLHIVALISTEEDQSPMELPAGRRVLRLIADDFTFSPMDAAAYFQSIGLSVSPSDCSLACSYTGGQATGLCLQGHFYRKAGAFAPYAPDQLIEHSLWKDLSLSEKECFLALSLTPVFTQELACFLTGLSPESTERLLTSCPLIYAGSQAFYKMHDWFLRFLQPRFSLLPEPNRCRLLRRAGEWFLTQNEREEAIRFLYRAGERERIFSLFESWQQAPAFSGTDDSAMVLSLLRDTPRDIRLRYPCVLLLLCHTLLLQQQNRELKSCIPELRALIDGSSLPAEERSELCGGLEFLLIFLHMDRLEDMDLHFHRALGFFQSTRPHAMWQTFYSFGCPSLLCLFHRSPGDLRFMVRQFDENLDLYTHLTGGHGKGGDLLLRAEVSFMAGDMLTADILCSQAEKEARAQNQYDIVTGSLLLSCRTALFMGNRKNYDQAFSSLQSQYLAATSRQEVALCDLSCGFLAAVTAKPEKAPLWLLHGADAGTRLDFAALAFSRIITGRLMLFRQDHPALLTFCQEGLTEREGPVFLLTSLYLTIYKACALEAIGSRGQALTCLQQALQMAQPDELYLPFAENWDRLQPLMAQIPATTLPHDVRKKIENWGANLLFSLHNLFDPPKPLTSREQDVLDLLSRGLNNRQIAKELDLTLPGVQKVMARLLEKTGARSRAHLWVLHTG